MRYAMCLAPAILGLAACDAEVTDSSSPADQTTPTMTADYANDLQSALDAKKAEWAAGATDDAKALYDDGIAKVKATGVLNTMKSAGDTAPAFELPDATGKVVNSADLLAQGPVIVVFYRGAWCPYCNITLAQWQQYLDEIQALGGQLVAISPQLPDYTLSSQEKNDLKFTVLSDVGNKAASDFGITTQVTPEIVKYWEGKIDLVKHNGDESAQLPLPATYLIGSDGKIHFAHAHEDYRVRAEPAEVLTRLKALQGN